MELLHHEIAVLAYSIWQCRTLGLGPDQVDRSLGDWYLAERILNYKHELHHARIDGSEVPIEASIPREMQ